MVISSKNDIKQLGTILGIWAHPDDETYSMGGIMAAAIKNGQKVACITATRGEAGVQDEKRWPAAKLANIRTKELKDAMHIMGVTQHYWFDYPDGGCHEVKVQDAVNKIVHVIKAFKPDSILTFGEDGMTGHDDHKTVSLWAGLALKQSESSAVLYHCSQTPEQYEAMLEADKQFNVFFNIDKPAICEDCDCSICYTLEDDVYDIKLKALKAMPSQTEGMLKMFEHMLRPSIGKEAFVEAIKIATSSH